MKRYQHVLAVVAACAGLVCSAAPPAAAQAAWPLVFSEESEMKDCPQQPGALAVLLVREEIMDFETGATKIFRRLKILTPAGLERSNIEIPFVVGREKVTGIEARVVPPRGPARVFTGQVYEKTAMRYRRLRVAVKTFAIPDVEVGSIIDYRYRIEPDHGRVSAKGLEDIVIGLEGGGWEGEEGGIAKSKTLRAAPVERWEVQEDLFTKRARFTYANKGLFLMRLLGAGYRLAWASVGIADGSPKLFTSTANLELKDIPAFEAEEFTIPGGMLRMSVDLFFVNDKLKDGAEFWRLESRDWQKGVEDFLGKPAKLAGVANGIVGDAAEPRARLERLYRKVQGLRNLSYENMTRNQRKEQKIKENRKVLDVLDRGYGLRSDITRTFVALARAAGFEAEVVRVVSRDDKLFRKDVLSFYGQFDAEAALVKLGDKTLLFDPATPFCPFGLGHWSRTNTTAVRFSNDPPAFFTTPLLPPAVALTQREIALALGPQGGLEGTVKTTYIGQEALIRRLDHLRDDAATRKAAFEKELTELLPAGASVSLTRLDNFDNGEPALVAACDVKIPRAAAAAGDKLLLPVSPLTGPGRYPFRPSARKSAVYFPYACREFDDIVVTLPEGLTAEVRPEPRRDDNDAFSYSLVCSREAPGRLHIQRDLVIKKIFYPVERYASIKGFFDAARAADEAQIVLTGAKGPGEAR